MLLFISYTKIELTRKPFIIKSCHRLCYIANDLNDTQNVISAILYLANGNRDLQLAASCTHILSVLKLWVSTYLVRGICALEMTIK